MATRNDVKNTWMPATIAVAADDGELLLGQGAEAARDPRADDDHGPEDEPDQDQSPHRAAARARGESGLRHFSNSASRSRA